MAIPLPQTPTPPELMFWQDKLRYDVNCLCEIEIRSGVPVQDMLEGGIGLSTVRLFVWGGLFHLNPLITVEDAGTLINGYMQQGGEIPDIIVNMTTALKESGLIKREEDGDGSEGKASGEENPSQLETGSEKLDQS